MALNICSRKGYNSYPQVQRVEAWAQKAEHWATEDFSQLWNLMETCWTLKLLESSDPFLLCMSLLLKWEWLSLLFYACPTIEFGACFPVHRSAPEWIIHRVSTIPDLDNVDVEIWDFGLFCNRMRFLEMLGWGKYILLVGWMWILGSQDADYSYYSWWQITPKLNGTKQSFIMIPGFIRSRMWTCRSRAFLCSVRLGRWLKDSKAGDGSHLKAWSLTCLEVDTGCWLGISAPLNLEEFGLPNGVVTGFSGWRCWERERESLKACFLFWVVSEVA